MNSLPALFSRINRVVFVLGIVLLATTLAGVIFVAASSNDGAVPETHLAAHTKDAATKAKIAERFSELPLSFEINDGQTDKAVKFVSHGPGYDLFLTANEAVLSLRKPQSETAHKVEGAVLRLKLLGANADPRVEGKEQLPGKLNYFIGNDRNQWRRNISTYRKVHYTDIYPGIDIVYYGNQRELEYDFVVAPGANSKLIKFRVEGAKRLRLDQHGNLLLALEHGEVRLNKPFVYQLTDEGSRSEVKGSYVIKGNEISFKMRGADSAKPLVIDPVLSYSTFLGGTGHDQAFGIAVDAQGSAYVTGTTNSFLFPTTPGAFKTGNLAGAFVTKLDPTGSSLIYSTFLSGRESDRVIVSGSPFTGSTAIAVDSSGNAHITGSTTDPDFPVVKPLKTSGIFFKTTNAGSIWSNNNAAPTEGLSSLAVAPINPNVIYAGSSKGVYRSTDAGATWTKTSTANLPESVPTIGLAVDPTNSSIVYAGSLGLFKTTDGGNNWNPVNLPVQNPGIRTIVFDPSTPTTIYVGSHAGVFRSTDNGSTWTGLNNFGTPGPEEINSIAIDPAAPATIYAGSTFDGIFKTTNGGSSWTEINNGITSSPNTSSRFIEDVIIDPFNSSTLYLNALGTINKSTNGGSSWAPVNNSAVRGGINAMLADRSTPNTLYVGTVGGGVIKTTDGGTSWTSVNNGLWSGIIRVLAVDPSNPATLYAGGSDTVSTTDAFVSTLNSSGSDLLFSTYLGGSGDEVGNGIAVDGSGNIYVAGNTKSTNLRTLNAFQPAPLSATDLAGNGFVIKLNPAAPAYVFSTYLGGSAKDEANGIAIDSAANIYVTGDTSSTDFPATVNAFQTNIASSSDDAFVTKLNSSGSLSYSTYLGGNNSDIGYGIAVDASGNAYVTGVTSATDFPTANPIQATNGSSTGDVFVTKLNGQGSTLVYSTYLGGAGNDTGRGIAVDATGNAYVTGISGSIDFPLVAGALRTKSQIFKSVDAGANWNNESYGAVPSSITQLAIHPTQTATIYAGTTLGIFKSTNAGKTWFPINNGLTGFFINGLVIDPLIPSTLYVSAGTDFGNSGGIFKSTDGGNSWNLRTNGITNLSLISLAIDPVTPTTLYAGANFGPIYKTTDGADHWAPSGNGPFFPSSLAVDPHAHTRIFATNLSSGGGIFRSDDSGATWQSVGLNQTSAFGRFIAVSPHTPGLVYAVMNGTGLFKSVDGGDNWSSLRPDSRFGKVVLDPVSASTVYYLSDTEGLLKSTDNGQTWMPLNHGPGASGTTALAINPLRSSTMYRATVVRSGLAAFVTKINPPGNALVYSTYLGGINAPDDIFGLNNEAFAIAIDSAGDAYVTGMAQSPDFPISTNGFQPINLGFEDAFISKLTMSHIISGHVLEGGVSPVNGAEVVLNDGVSQTAVITDTDGSYEFSRLRAGGSFTVSAAKPHFTMAPPSQNFSNLNNNQTLDFIATPTNAPFFTISGQVTDNGAGLAGVTVTLAGSQSGLRTTDSNGNYSFEVAGGGNYSVTASLFPFSFNPPSQSFNNLSASQTASFTATRQSLVVTNANNHGAGSLREVITNANAIPGTDTITFNIPGAGVRVINLVTPLPEITEPVVIDASTQPGYNGTPLIELDGNNLGSFENGLVIKAGNTTVRGLAIGSFGFAGIVLRACNNNVIQGNHLGIDATGTQPRPNRTGLLLIDSSNNIIGGTTAAARNVISGNEDHGVEVGGANNVIQGNYIGTNAAGTDAVPNTTNGVQIAHSTNINNLITGNLISGNTRGIHIESPGNTVQGNLIGTDFTGTKKVPNSFGIQADSPNTLIGGLTPAARNIISGNGSTGVSFGNVGSKLQGNFIGTDITGTQALGNGGEGVISGTNAVIGGTDPEARNVISGNGGSGNLVLGLLPFGPGAIVQGNYIGTDVTGTRSLSESTVTGIGIFSSNNLIGGLVPGAQNVISGNISGIHIGTFFSGPPQGNAIQGNLIGLNALGTGPLPNSQIGIAVFDAFNNTVGGTQSEAANKIAFNGEAGIANVRGRRISVRGNSIFSNGTLGINLSDDGVTGNDAADADEGPNDLQNFPVLTSVLPAGNSTTIQGSLNSAPNTIFQIDFYSSAALDPSGHGEGALFFGTTSVTTNSNGDATINETFPVALSAGRVVTATATDPNGNTSEFSAGDVTSAAGNLQFSVDSIRVLEDVAVLNVTVLRKGGSAGNLTIDYATTDGTATAGQDYTSTFGTLTFTNGETSKSFQIPIVDDAVTEPDETFTVALRNAPSLESLGAPSTLVVTIQDRATPPVIVPGFASVVEGNTGSTTEALITFTLSAVTGRTVSANYATANFSATGGASCGNQGTDYESVSGTITFQPGNTAATIPVKICGDSSAEGNELFLIALSNPSNATLDDHDGSGTIIDDDFLRLLSEESAPGQAAALDAFLLVRDPFRAVLPDWFPITGADRNTRVLFFVRGLQLDPGELSSAVVVHLFDDNFTAIDLPAEDVRAVPGVDFAQVRVRLPDGLAPGGYLLNISAHSRTTNFGTIRIAP